MDDDLKNVVVHHKITDNYRRDAEGYTKDYGLNVKLNKYLIKVLS